MVQLTVVVYKQCITAFPPPPPSGDDQRCRTPANPRCELVLKYLKRQQGRGPRSFFHELDDEDQD